MCVRGALGCYPNYKWFKYIWEHQVSIYLTMHLGHCWERNHIRWDTRFLPFPHYLLVVITWSEAVASASLHTVIKVNWPNHSLVALSAGWYPLSASIDSSWTFIDMQCLVISLHQVTLFKAFFCYLVARSTEVKYPGNAYNSFTSSKRSII